MKKTPNSVMEKTLLFSSQGAYICIWQILLLLFSVHENKQTKISLELTSYIKQVALKTLALYWVFLLRGASIQHSKISCCHSHHRRGCE